MTNRMQVTRLNGKSRLGYPARIFGGMDFPFKVEPTIYGIAKGLMASYMGGYWEMYRLNDDGFYMAPRSTKTFRVICPNGYEGSLSADAFGIAVCLYAYSTLSFTDGDLGQVCARQFHRLREYALDHLEAGAIFRATD